MRTPQRHFLNKSSDYSFKEKTNRYTTIEKKGAANIT